MDQGVLIRQLQAILGRLSGQAVEIGTVSCPTGDTTVPHSLGRTPRVWPSPFYSGGATAFNLVIKSTSPTNFVISNGSAITVSVFWLAIG